MRILRNMARVAGIAFIEGLRGGSGAVRPHAEHYGHITEQLTDQVHHDLRGSWSLPPPAHR